jgi:hypothetical protein
VPRDTTNGTTTEPTTPVVPAQSAARPVLPPTPVPTVKSSTSRTPRTNVSPAQADVPLVSVPTNAPPAKLASTPSQTDPVSSASPAVRSARTPLPVRFARRDSSLPPPETSAQPVQPAARPVPPSPIAISAITGSSTRRTTTSASREADGVNSYCGPVLLSLPLPLSPPASSAARVWVEERESKPTTSTTDTNSL